MKKVMILITLVAVLALLLASACSDKSSSEACRYEVTMNLDNGNYDAVLASACADAMQLGAAWFGKAGFDMQEVINRMIDANDTSAGPADSDLNIFMTALVSKVTETTFTYLDNAIYQYDLVTQTTPTGSNNNKDAQFYQSLAETMKSLSLIKVLIDVDGDGAMSSCDINGNGTPDEVEAASCALKISSNIVTGSTYSCTDVASVAPLTPVDMLLSNLSGTPLYTYTYSGLITTITGTATATCPSPAEYKKLLYADGSNVGSPTGDYFVATTLSGDNCANSANKLETWPCPLESNLDFVATVDQTLTSAIDTLSSSLTGSTSTDVQQSINDIKGTNCCTGAGESTADPSACTCSSSELATYLETI